MARDVLDISRYVGVSHSQRAIDRLTGFETRFSNVLQTGHLPENGFSEAEIEAILHRLALMDSNNWSNSTGVGEREGRILLDLVRRRHFGLAHGIGRSGDITAIQPKAPGSSLINQLVNSLLLDWLRRSGAPSTASCLLVPMATGMALTFCLLTLKRRRGAQAKYVIWPRIDQKSCLKCIATAGLIPVPIEPVQSSGRWPKNKGPVAGDASGELPADQLTSNLPAIEAAIKDPEGSLLETPATDRRPGPESVVCVLSTTSCFSPRVPDRLLAISSLCEAYNVPHLINNAYGVQSKRCMGMIEASWSEVKRRRQPTRRSLDFLYVQSTDKNLMVPVGGSIIAGFSTDLVRDIAESYPGRASGTPSLDVFATLLYLGRGGWDSLVSKREACYLRLAEGLQGIAVKHRLRLMQTPDNPISLALSLQGLGDDQDPDTLTLLGSKLFTQGCSGVRVVVPASMEARKGQPVKVVAGVRLPGFNSHSSTSKEAYLNAAAAIGQTPEEIDLFLKRLDKVLADFKRTVRSRSGAGKSTT